MKRKSNKEKKIKRRNFKMMRKMTQKMRILKIHKKYHLLKKIMMRKKKNKMKKSVKSFQ
jgi:hypothetical protein